MQVQDCIGKADIEIIHMLKDEPTRQDAQICLYVTQYDLALGMINSRYQHCPAVMLQGADSLASEVVLKGIESVTKKILDEELDKTIGAYCFGVWRNSLNGYCPPTPKDKDGNPKPNKPSFVALDSIFGLSSGDAIEDDHLSASKKMKCLKGSFDSLTDRQKIVITLFYFFGICIRYAPLTLEELLNNPSLDHEEIRRQLDEVKKREDSKQGKIPLKEIGIIMKITTGAAKNLKKKANKAITAPYNQCIQSKL